MMNDGAFQILFVCTANLCRSQVAEARLRQHATTSHLIDVRSAGTRAVPGSHIPRRFRTLFDRHEVETLTAERVSAAALDRADLVLTMTRAQRSEVVQILPRSVQYTYPVVQFVELAERVVRADPRLCSTVSRPGGYQRMMDSVNGDRGSLRGTRESVDIPDPAKASARQLRKVVTELTACIDRLADVLQLTSAAECSAVQKLSIMREIARAI